MENIRKLTIGKISVPGSNAIARKQVPVLRIRGKWFEEAGFEAGKYAYLSVRQNQILVSVFDRKTKAKEEKRKLKISSFETRSRFSSSQYPCLTIKGNWLCKHGFDMHMRVDVQVLQNSIVIRPHKRKAYKFLFPPYQAKNCMFSYFLENDQAVEVRSRHTGELLGLVEKQEDDFLTINARGLKIWCNTEEAAVNWLIKCNRNTKSRARENPAQLRLI